MDSIYQPRTYTGFSYILRFLRRLLYVLIFYLVTRAAFYLYNAYLFPDTQWTDMWLIYKGGLRFDLAALGYLNGAWLLLALLPFPFVYRYGYQLFLKIIYTVCNAVGFFCQFFDFEFFRFRLSRTDFTFFQEFENDVNTGNLIWEGLKDYVPFLLILALLVFLLCLSYGRLRYERRPAFTLRFLLIRTATLCVAALLTVAAIRGGIDRTTRPIAMSNAAAYTRHPVESALVLNTPFCLIRTMGSHGLERLDFFEDTRQLNEIYTPEHLPQPAAPVAVPDSLKPNVVVLILESFSREHTGFLNPPGHPSYTPFLDSLMACSLTCTNAYANGRKSIDAIPSILGSIPSFETPFALTPYALEPLDGMARLLERWGYHTAFFHGAPNGSMGFDGLVRQMGFAAYYGKDQFNDNSQYDGVWGIWDEPFLQFFARTLNTFETPFLGAVFTVSSHHPFIVPAAYAGVFPKGSIPIHQCIGYTDNALRLFFKTASTMPWYHNTLFVLTADHGAYSQLYPEYQTPDGSMAIPIIYYMPGKVPAGKYEAYTQQIDIMPTVLDNIHYPYGYVAFGRNLNDSLTVPFSVHYPNELLLLRQEKEEEPDNELFLKAFRQQYNNRLLDGNLQWPEE